jgi:hypothetical protein
MKIELTKEEIEAITIDVAHILDKITLSEVNKEVRRSLLSKLSNLEHHVKCNEVLENKAELINALCNVRVNYNSDSIRQLVFDKLKKILESL